MSVWKLHSKREKEVGFVKRPIVRNSPLKRSDRSHSCYTANSLHRLWSHDRRRDRNATIIIIIISEVNISRVKQNITRGWALDRMHNSRLLYVLADCDPMTLNNLTFWPNISLLGGQGIAVDYHCGKNDDCSFNRFGFYRADRHTESQTRMIDILTRLPPASVKTEKMRHHKSVAYQYVNVNVNHEFI